MATARVTVAAAWGASPDITASADTAVLIRNTTTSYLFFAITLSDTAPAFVEGEGHQVRPSWSNESEVSLVLKNGERLWMAMPEGPKDITLTTGDA